VLLSKKNCMRACWLAFAHRPSGRVHCFLDKTRLALGVQRGAQLVCAIPVSRCHGGSRLSYDVDVRSLVGCLVLDLMFSPSADACEPLDAKQLNHGFGAVTI
jgi:hypothetical protein